MIQSFLASWELFHHSYIAGCLIALLLSTVGVLVVARDQIFLGAAVSQASTLGIALGLQLAASHAETSLPWLQSDGFLSCMAVLFCVMAAVFTMKGGRRKQESYEASTGWVFLVSSSLSILIASRSPHGMEEIQRLLASSIIGATETDLWNLGGLFLLTTCLLGATHQRVILLAMDPAMAGAVGLNTRFWETLLSVWLGIAVGFSMRAAGMLYVFGCLVLPPLIAKNLCREVLPLFIVSPCSALMCSLFGFMMANHYDYPPGQMTVAVLCLALAAIWTIRRWARVA
jgi:ABC-type Mn2+/Zn2+ transport system permease subunit